MEPRPHTDADLEIQSGKFDGRPYAVIFSTEATPQYIGQVKALSHPRPGMMALQQYMKWREFHAAAVNTVKSQR